MGVNSRIVRSTASGAAVVPPTGVDTPPVPAVCLVDAAGNILTAQDNGDGTALFANAAQIVTYKNVIQATGVANNASAVSAVIPAATYRRMRLQAYGSSGNIDARLEWSPTVDGDTGWHWIVQQAGSQYQAFVTDVITPYVRVEIVNNAGTAQDLTAHLVLST